MPLSADELGFLMFLLKMVGVLSVAGFGCYGIAKYFGLFD